jgi:tetratricopeptide (TPR) repeat protein
VIGDAPAISVESIVRRLLPADDTAKHAATIAHLDLTPEVAHQVVLDLADEAFRLIGVDPRRMEQVCVVALSLAERFDDLYGWALARMRYGEALRFQGRNAEALTSLDEAAAVFLRLGLPVEAARTRVNWVWAAAALGRLADALAAARSARRVLMAHGAIDRVAALDTNTGNLLLDHGRYRAALRRFTSAMALFQSLGEPYRFGVLRNVRNRGLVFTRLGYHRKALTELAKAGEGYREIGEITSYARTLHSIGENKMALGRYAAALRDFDEALPVMRDRGLSADAVSLARTMADCYLYLSRPNDALATLAEADGDLIHTDSAMDALGVATRRVAALLVLDEREAARQALDEAEQRFPVGVAQHRAWLAVERAALLLRDGQIAEALAVARRAERLARTTGIRHLTARSLLVQSEALLAQSDTAEAARAASQAARLARLEDAAPLLYRVNDVRGRIAEASRRPALAARRYRAAIDQLEREQHGVIFEFRDRFDVDRSAAYERLAALQLAAGRPIEAFATAERAKSRALADAIAGRVELRPRGNPTARRLTRELAAAREDYSAVAYAVRRRAGEDGGTRVDDRRTLHELESRISTLMQRLQLAGAADDAPGLYGSPADPTVPALPADSALIEFYFSGADILRFQLGHDGVRGDVLAGAVPDIERLLRTFRLNLDATERAAGAQVEGLTSQARTILGRLYTRLLDGVDGLAALRSLVIVPHGLLHYLPFHALWDGERYLVERCAVSYAPSATLYAVCRARAGRTRRGRALVLGHSGDGRLPYVLQEAETVAAVLSEQARLEQAATRRLLETDGRRARIIHIAAHGRFRADAPLFSQIDLADGPLTAADIFGLDLRSALVTLSACETGRAVLGGGDELAGLARAFLYAGAAGLLVSQWRVDDAATAMLMARFYRGLSRGIGSAQALRAAQIAHIDAAMPQSARRHPFYWAGFQFIGADHTMQKRPARAHQEVGTR